MCINVCIYMCYVFICVCLYTYVNMCICIYICLSYDLHFTVRCRHAHSQCLGGSWCWGEIGIIVSSFIYLSAIVVGLHPYFFVKILLLCAVSKMKAMIVIFVILEVFFKLLVYRQVFVIFSCYFSVLS